MTVRSHHPPARSRIHPAPLAGSPTSEADGTARPAASQVKSPAPGVLAYILISGVLGVAGQIVLKQGLSVMGPLVLSPSALPGTILSLALNPLVVLGLTITVSGTFFWLIALSRVDLSFAYPFASLNYVLVLGASWLVLGEQVSPVRLVGVLAICLGVCLIMRTPIREEQRGQTTGAGSGTAPWRRPA